MSAPRDLVAEARAMAIEIHPGHRYLSAPINRQLATAGNLLTELADELEAAYGRIADLRPCSTAPTEDTAVIDAETPAGPIPAEGAPHAYVALTRTFSPHADRPEWAMDAVVIPEWDREQLDYARWRGWTLLSIGPDGDTGTRAIVEPRVIEDPVELDALLTGAIVMVVALSGAATPWQLLDYLGAKGGRLWTAPFLRNRYGSADLLKRFVTVTVLYVPTEEPRDGE